MLQHLKIRNYAIISQVDVEFNNGFNVITGETGAGKSILLGALGLLLGNRADTSILNNSESKCIIEGQFIIQKKSLKSFFEQNDLDFDTHTIIRREISPSGKSRAFINDTPVNLNVLKNFSEQLIDIHSQHQTLQLNNSGFQLSIIDAISNNKSLLTDYKSNYKKLKEKELLLQEMLEQDSQSKKDLDYFQFQLNEINQLDPKPFEETELEDELKILSNSDKIKTNLDNFRFIIDGQEGNVLELMVQSKKLLHELSGFNNSLSEFDERIESIIIELKDVVNEIDVFSGEVEVNEEKLFELTERLNKLNHLFSKHQFSNSEELIAYAQEIQEKLDQMESFDQEILKINEDIKIIKDQTQELANTISQNRHGILSKVEDQLVHQLTFLGMKDARIKLLLEQLPELTETGKDKLSILFSSNLGHELQPLNKVISGGELSRLMLSIKYLLADAYQIPTIIFDEIDMGISGEIAIKVGEIISELSLNHQVISITHLPQVAAMGKSHYLVYKENINQITETKIKHLSEENRILEIAKMIGGDHPGETAILSSKELVKKFS